MSSFHFVLHYVRALKQNCLFRMFAAYFTNVMMWLLARVRSLSLLYRYFLFILIAHYSKPSSKFPSDSPLHSLVSSPTGLSSTSAKSTGTSTSPRRVRRSAVEDLVRPLGLTALRAIVLASSLVHSAVAVWVKHTPRTSPTAAA